MPPGEFKQEKLGTFQRNLLVRWINTLDVWENYLSVDNIIEELKNGVLICNILKFHQPNLDFTGVNNKARAKKQCLNNIEKALSILYQKGAAPRYIPSADEIFEGDKFQDKIWVMLKTIFDVFAMHDVTLLLPKIVKWLNNSLSYFYERNLLGNKQEELYQDFKTGVPLACILALYVENEELQPDFRLIYEHPQNRQEVLSNLSYVFSLAIKNNVPIYLKPQEYLDNEQHNFLMLQLYYLYCKFKNSKPLFSKDDPPQLIFKDEGRILEDNSQTSGQSNTSPKRSSRNQTESSDIKPGSMGIIDEVDSGEFSSTMKSQQQKSQEQKAKINQQKVQQFLNQANQQYYNQQQQYIQQQQQQQQQHSQRQYAIHSNNMLSDDANEEDGNVMDDEELDQKSEGTNRSQSDLNMMRQNIKQASSTLVTKMKSPRDFQAIVDENIGIFSNQVALSNNTSAKDHQLNGMGTINLPKVEPYIQERRGLFMEDLRGQISIKGDRGKVIVDGLNEEQLTQMYYSSAGVNQTANFNNFNTFDGSQTHANHSKHDSLMGGNNNFFMQKVEVTNNNHNQITSNMDYQQERLRIFDENGDLDEFKCLQLLFTPQIATISIGNQILQKAFLFVKTSECFYSELNEGYNIKILEYPTRKLIIEIKFHNIETILMKNIIQRQFIIQADSGKVKIAIEINDKSDQYFQALNYIFQKTAIKRF